MLDTLWYEKYRPKKLEDLVISQGLKDKILEFKKQESIPHLLFYGSAGIGKTSLAKIIVDEVLDCETLVINASKEGGIDNIRTEVNDFATSASLDGKIKVVIFGEADGMSNQAQDSLNELIEESSETTRFIFTANNISKLRETIVSRCQRFIPEFTESQYIKACVSVLQKENIEFRENLKPLRDLLQGCYPDFRVAIGEMQKNSTDGSFKPPTEVSDEFVGTVWKLIEKEEPEVVREHCIKKPEMFKNHADLLVRMIVYSYKHFDINLCRKVTLVINEYLVKDVNHTNKEINFYCCLITLNKLGIN